MIRLKNLKLMKSPCKISNRLLNELQDCLQAPAQLGNYLYCNLTSSPADIQSRTELQSLTRAACSSIEKWDKVIKEFKHIFFLLVSLIDAGDVAASLHDTKN